MSSKSDFIKGIIKNTLHLPLTDEGYSELGGSRNILYNSALSNTPYIGDGCAETLKNIIIQTSNNNTIKKKLAIGFLKDYLTKNELEFVEKCSNDIEIITKIAIQKFTHPNNKYFCHGTSKKIKACSLKGQRDLCIKKISTLITNIIEYLNFDLILHFQ